VRARPHLQAVEGVQEGPAHDLGRVGEVDRIGKLGPVIDHRHPIPAERGHPTQGAGDVASPGHDHLLGGHQDVDEDIEGGLADRDRDHLRLLARQALSGVFQGLTIRLRVAQGAHKFLGTDQRQAGARGGAAGGRGLWRRPSAPVSSARRPQHHHQGQLPAGFATLPDGSGQGASPQVLGVQQFHQGILATSADLAAVAVDVLGQVDVDDLRRRAPQDLAGHLPGLGLAAASTDGALDPPIGIHQHLGADLARGGAPGPDHGGDGYRLAGLQSIGEFQVESAFHRESLPFSFGSPSRRARPPGPTGASPTPTRPGAPISRRCRGRPG